MPAPDLSALAPRDQEAIARTLTSLLAGFSERNVDKLANVYSDDADWVQYGDPCGTAPAQRGNHPCRVSHI